MSEPSHTPDTEGVYSGEAAPSQQLLIELGKMTLAASALEATTHEVAGALNLTPASSPLWQVQEGIKKACGKFGLPSWSRTTADELFEWIRDATGCMARRHQIVHSKVAAQYLPNGELNTYYWSFKGNRRSTFNVGAVRKCADAIDDAHLRGLRLWKSLLPQVRVGFCIALLPLGSPGYGVLDAVGGKYPPRPADAEIKAFIDDFDAKLWLSNEHIHYKGPSVSVRDV